MKMKKWLAFLLAGVMVLSLSTVAFAEWYQSWETIETSPGVWETVSKPVWFDGYDGDCNTEAVAYEEPQSPQDAQAEADALAAQEMGIPQPVLYAAAAEGKSVGEYSNNAVVSTHGIEDATPVAQGGNVIINGQATNQTFSVGKALPAHIDYAKQQAATVGGKVLNVVNIGGGVRFDTATVNFYMPGVTAGQNIHVYQYVGGQWVDVAVAEIREDHVVVDMTQYGVLSFVEVPTVEAAEADAEAEIAAVEAEAEAAQAVQE